MRPEVFMIIHSILYGGDKIRSACFARHSKSYLLNYINTSLSHDQNDFTTVPCPDFVSGSHVEYHAVKNGAQSLIICDAGNS
jgi:hypothetical protein